MKLPLITIVQDMLAAVDAENVTDVGETVEASTCVSIVNRCVEDILTAFKWRHLRQYISFSTTTALNEMVLPTNCTAVDPDNVYYNSQHVFYRTPEDFLGMTITRTGSNITTINGINVYNDRKPQFFTSDDDQTLIFDALDDPISGLSASLTNGIGYITPVTRLAANADIALLPSVVFPALEMYAIGMAIDELKGDPNSAKLKIQKAIGMLSVMKRNARLIDIEDDVRKWIVPRQSAHRLYSPLINTGNGLI